jgi:hypothetical protein
VYIDQFMAASKVMPFVGPAWKKVHKVSEANVGTAGEFQSPHHGSLKQRENRYFDPEVAEIGRPAGAATARA